MKSSKPKKAKPQDKLSSSFGPLASKPAAAADPFGTYPVSRTLITAPGQLSVAAADRISASNRGEISGGNPLVSILKPPMTVASGFPAGDSPFPGASKPISFEVASPRGELLRVAMSGTGDALAQPISDSLFGGSSLTHVSGMGGGELLFTPLAPERLAL
jgi:hypothetical protein